jgi:hypothetical protein
MPRAAGVTAERRPMQSHSPVSRFDEVTAFLGVGSGVFRAANRFSSPSTSRPPVHRNRKQGKGDPHSDLALDILDAIPRSRINDVCYLDVADDVRPFGFDPATRGRQPQAAGIRRFQGGRMAAATIKEHPSRST